MADGYTKAIVFSSPQGEHPVRKSYAASTFKLMIPGYRKQKF